MDASFSARLRDSLQRHADRSAVDGRQSRLTYGELDRASAALAHALRARGVKPGDIIPLMLKRSPAAVIAQVALLRVGAAYAPIDLASPEVRQRAMLDQISTPLTLTDHRSANIEFLSGPTFDIESFAAEPMAHLHSPVELDDGWFESKPGDLAYVMFTSGTTGKPKGVLVPQSGITRLVCDADYADFLPDSRWGCLGSPAFDLSTLEIWAPLLNGGCCVVQEMVTPSLDDIASYIISEKITDLWLTSSLFNAMIDDRLDAFPGVRQLMVGGERVSPRHARAVLERYPDIRLINGYGPTENTTFTTCHDITLGDCDNPVGIPIGRAIRGTTIRVAAPESVQSVARGSEGELLAGGEGVALGYLNAEELTAKKFVCIDGERWYRTGDIVRQREDGAFEYLGRVDRQIKLQGNRIELDEVERTLAAFPGVALCAVLVRGSSAENRYLVAVYTGVHGAPAVDDVVEFLSAHLPPPAVPTRLIPVDRIPLSTTGKIDQVALATLVDSSLAARTSASERDPAFNERVDTSDVSTPSVAVLPMSDSERQLMAIWQHYLPAASIDRTTHFLSVGGTSLLALQVSAQVRRKLGKNLTPIDVLRLPVLFEQARAIDTAAVFDVDGTNESGSDLGLPLTQTQRAMLAAMQLDDTDAAYLVHVALRFDRTKPIPDAQKLKRAFATLAARHPALRMTLPDATDSMRAQVRPALPEGWWRIHAPIETAPGDLQWSDELMQTVNAPINLSRDGVMRVDYWPVAADSTLLVWTVNHIAIDDASIDRALVELDALLKGTSLEPVFGSPLGFAAFERAWTNRDAVREWPKILIAALHNKVTTVPRAPGRGDEFAVRLPDGLVSELRSACDRWGMTPFAPLLSAYGEAVQEVFGAHNRFVNTPFSRRTETELLEPIGCLLDVNLIEAGRKPGETAATALQRIHATALKLQRLQFLPRRDISEVVARVAPDVANQLSAFAFTWRINPSRDTSLGGAAVRVVRVPQQSALFGVSLHAWQENSEIRCSIEAMQGLLDDGRAVALGNAFVQRLQALCEIDQLSAPATDGGTARQEHVYQSGDRTEQLQRVWSHWVGVPPGDVLDSSNFLRCGGNSLTVMRMMAQLRRQHGLRIEPAEFLAQPTFQNLRELAGEGVSWSSEYGEMVGPVDAPNVVVFLPGGAGPTLGSYNLAREAQGLLGPDFAGLLVDLDTMLRRAESKDLVKSVHDGITTLLTEIGWNRIVAFVGYSSGGIIALSVARDPRMTRKPSIWLLDTYAPDSLANKIFHPLVNTSLKTWVRKGAARLARPLLRNARIAAALGTHVRGREPVAPPASPEEVARNAFHEQLYRVWDSDTGTETHLVQATKTIEEVKLVWRGDTNGFNPRNHGSWNIYRVSGDHHDVTGPLAVEISALISANLSEKFKKTPRGE